MEKFLALRSDQFGTELTADYLEFVVAYNKWFKDMLDKAGLDIRELEATGELEEQDEFSEVFLGGELAVWLRDGLLKNGCEKAIEPVMEDYGWCFFIHYQGREFHIDIWDSLGIVEDYDWIIGFKEFKPFWKFAMNKDPEAMERMAKIVEQLLDNSAAANKYKWFSQNPLSVASASAGVE